ncbi:hypothetical protein [Cupriavidus pinatubonensis]|uniref:hypothetical protein n=1 Tax=Cupriavidus pinatubonensis TaxID=248026 RepID=UPI00366CCECF
MTLLIDNIFAQAFQYSPLEVDKGTYRFVNKRTLSELAKQGKRGIALPGKKHGIDTAFFYFNAWMLGKVAREYSLQTKDPSIAVLFRDTDGTNSSANDLWKRKWESMIQGFARAEYECGVPMLPKPKSEAWLLCAVKDMPYQNCAALEELSGNDDSPDSAKARLEEAMDGRTSAADVCEWLRETGFDHDSVAGQMTSYREFRLRLMEVLDLCK